MFIISQPCSLELCLYKVKRGNFGITVQKYPHTQQHIIHKAPRLYITKIYIDRTWSVQCIIQLVNNSNQIQKNGNKKQYTYQALQYNIKRGS